VAYQAEIGYGYVDEGLPDVVSSCGAEPHQTIRRDPGGRIVYRLDHLLPGHFYHLDVVLFECDGAGRQEYIKVNGMSIAGPIDLGDGDVHRLSLLLDPALYGQQSISVTIEAPGIDGAVVSAVNVYDIDYRYANAGGPQDLQYPGTRQYGWLNGVALSPWGNLPYQSVRINQDGNEVQYRYDGLDPSKRYNVHFTFWQPSGTGRVQKVQIDGLDTGLTVDTGDYQIHRESVAVPASAYANDGNIVVGVVRLNAGSGAMINEVALEEETLTLGSSGCIVPETPHFSQTYGYVTINGDPAPVGTIIQAVTPRGDVAGCITVSTAGIYPFLRIHGEDNTANPPIPGMRAGELVAYRVNGAPAIATPLFYWQDDKASHQVDLAAGGFESQFILLNPGWNWFSLRVEPPAPLVNQVLSSIDTRYDRVLGENSIYVPSLPPVYNSLKELHAGPGYMVRIAGSTSVNLMVEGALQAPDTPIPLHTGWNWVGYLPTVTLPIETALQSIEGQYQLVHGRHGTYNPSLPDFSTLTHMNPGQGYMIFATAAITLTYPSNTTTGLLDLTTIGEQREAGLFVAATPYLAVAYGQLIVNGHVAAPGTIVEAVTPRGDIAGRSVVQHEGILGFMHIYGEDDTADPVIAGFREGEQITFRINGLPAMVDQDLNWQNDRATHAVSLSLTMFPVYLPFIWTD
jgi:hypothetical protein